MSFSEWSNQKKKKKQEETTTIPTTSNVSNNTATTGSKPSFSEWSNQKRPINSMEGWVTSSVNLINHVQDRAQNWFNDEEYQSQFGKITNLLAQAESL